jgi:hypothetical protein
MCWYGDPESQSLRLPSSSGIFALIKKYRITRTEEIHTDLIENDEITWSRKPKNANEPREVTLKVDIPEDDTRQWLEAYHGTSARPGVLQSIIRDGLLLPGTISSNGVLISPPSNHYPAQKEIFGIPQFGRAIFVSPYLEYARNNVFTNEFKESKIKYVLKCAVEPGSYKMFSRTVNNWREDEADKPEWRISDPRSVIVTKILVYGWTEEMDDDEIRI